MAGHSKWANIRHKKGKEDSKRGKAFTKLIKEITVAAREGGGDPDGNPRLRTLIDKAKQINMPQDNTNRAIKKGTGELPGLQYEHGLYEGYGPHGIAVMVDTLSDNTNRMIAELRHLFTKKGGCLGENGSVSWMFEHLGSIRVTGTINEDELLEQLLEYEIVDISKEDSLFFITCDPKALDQIRKAIITIGLEIENSELEWIPKNSMVIPEKDTEKAYEFLSALQDHDDVQNVYTNLA